MVRGYHISFESEEKRRIILDSFHNRFGLVDLLFHVLETMPIELRKKFTMYEICDFIQKYDKIPTSDLTIYVHELPESNCDECNNLRFTISQSSSGGGLDRKLKNAIRHTVLQLLMDIAEGYDYRYEVYVG